MKTGLSSAVYFYFLRFMENFLNEKNFFTSFFVSSFSRVLGAIASNPFTIIKTRFEIPGENRWRGSILDSLSRLYKIEGVNGLFKGCGASCLKEGSFAGIYYALYIEGKNIGLNSFSAGMIAGITSTILTHPF